MLCQQHFSMSRKRVKKRKRAEDDDVRIGGEKTKFVKFEEKSKRYMYIAWLRLVKVWIDNTNRDAHTIAIDVVLYTVALLAMTAHGQHPYKNLSVAKFREWIEEIKRKARDVVNRFIGNRLDTIPHYKIAHDIAIFENRRTRTRPGHEEVMLSSGKGNDMLSVEQLLTQTPVFRAAIRRSGKDQSVVIPLHKFRLRMSPSLMLFVEVVPPHLARVAVPLMTFDIPDTAKCENELVTECLSAAEQIVHDVSHGRQPAIPDIIKSLVFVAKPRKRAVSRRTICI